MMSSVKDSELKKIAERCKENTPDGFKHAADFQGGIFDNENYVSPWSIGAHNSDASLMLIGQDWVSAEWLNNLNNAQYAKLGRDPGFITNRNLEKYLKLFNLNFSDTYATNAFAYIKDGPVNASIKQKDFRNSVINNLVPQIAIIKPKMIICIGRMAFNEMRAQAKLFRVSIGKGHLESFKYMGAVVYGVYHTGGQGTANAGGNNNSLLQWEELARKYRQLIECPTPS